MKIGITSHGAYVPVRRFERAAMRRETSWFVGGLPSTGERSWCGWDEDVITMSVEAARDCLSGAAGSPQPGTVLMGSTTSPFADRLGAAMVGEALDLPDAVLTADVAGSFRAGTSALLQALRIARGDGGHHLCIASEQVRGLPASVDEASCGDAAASFLVGSEDLLAELLGSHSTSADFIDHFRATEAEVNYGWESRWVRDEGIAGLVPPAIEQALASAGVTPAEVSALVFPSPFKGAAASVAKRVGIRSEAVVDTVASAIGFSGSAAPLIQLSASLDEAETGDVIVVVGFGSGCDVLVFRRLALRVSGPRTGVQRWIARRRRDSNYLKFLAARGMIELDTGIRAEFDQKQAMSALWRSRKALATLRATEDLETGRVVFPPAAGSRARTDLAARPLSDEPAHVVTYTADRLGFSWDPPTLYGVIDFVGGGRMSTEFCDALIDDLEVGLQVRMMYRVKVLDQRRNFRTYFWKAAPDYLTPTTEES